MPLGLMTFNIIIIVQYSAQWHLILECHYAECHSCWVSFMLSVIRAECHLCWVSFTLSVIHAESHSCWVSFSLSVIQPECHSCWMSFSLSVKINVECHFSDRFTTLDICLFNYCYLLLLFYFILFIMSVGQTLK